MPPLPRRDERPADAAAFFDAAYARADDPWGFASEPYELDRYRHVVALVDDRRYRVAFEPACSIGVLTAMLAPLCDRLVASDVSGVAVDAARRRTASLAGVDVRVGALPGDEPDGPLDLVVFSEVGYYFDEPALAGVLARLVARLAPDGRLVACHWTGASADHVLSGDRVHAIVDAHPGLRRRVTERRPGYAIGAYDRRPPRGDDPTIIGRPSVDYPVRYSVVYREERGRPP